MADSKVAVTVSKYNLPPIFLDYENLETALVDLRNNEVHLDPSIEFVTARWHGDFYVLICDHCFEWEKCEQ